MSHSETDKHWMRRALVICRAGLERGQSPFGAVIVRAGTALAETHNQVWAQTDPSAHAEVMGIRAACAAVGTVHLEGATIYSTTEPCPMCFSCIHWARLGRIVYAARVEDAAAAGFNELPVPNATMQRISGSRMELVPEVLREEALALYEAWGQRGGKTY
jgi:tRNA(Arg) A34 adenosine deaminase TadA